MEPPTRLVRATIYSALPRLVGRLLDPIAPGGLGDQSNFVRAMFFHDRARCLELKLLSVAAFRGENAASSETESGKMPTHASRLRIRSSQIIFD